MAAATRSSADDLGLELHYIAHRDTLDALDLLLEARQSSPATPTAA